MIEFHGWLTLRENLTEIDSGELQVMIDYFDKIIARECFSFEINKKFMNGSCQMWISGNANHKGDELNRLMIVLKEIAKCANGSYGLVYIWDDEDEEYANEFQVYVIKRGVIEQARDRLLSPCVPIIEDAE